MLEPTTQEVNEVLDECSSFLETGTSKYPGMSYEDGVRAAVEWLKDDGPNPME